MTAPVTAIIPTWNRADLLPGAIRSVLQQTVRPAEVLVVDDGSTEDISAVTRRFPGVRCIRQENAGVARARNHGAAEARQKYIAFLDSDDRWVTTKTESQLRLLEATGAPVLGSRKRYIPAGPEPLLGGVPVSTAHHHIDFRKQTRRTWFAPSTMVFRRSAYLACGGFSSRFPIASDWALWLDLAWHAPIPRLDAVHALCFRSAVRMTGNRLAKYRSDLEIIRSWHPGADGRLPGATFERWSRRFATRRTLKLLQREGRDAASQFWNEARDVLPLGCARCAPMRTLVTAMRRPGFAPARSARPHAQRAADGEPGGR